jgi:hypothetical protein
MVLVVLAFAIIAKGIIDYLSRRQLQNKGADPEDSSANPKTATKWHLLSNLKWALVCIGFGLAAIVYGRFPGLFSTTGGFGLMFVGAGLGYLGYFFVAWRWTKTKGDDRQGNARAGSDDS